MNTGHLQAERAEQEAKEMDTLRYAGNTTIKVDTDDHEEEVAELVNQDDATVAYVSTGFDMHMDLEIMKRWNTHVELLAALRMSIGIMEQHIPKEARGYPNGCFKYVMGGDIFGCNCALCQARNAIAKATK